MAPLRNSNYKREPHEVRVLRQALKKAKNFEIKKVSRNLKQVVNGEVPSNNKRLASRDFTKLREHLEALKGLDLQPVLNKVCIEAGVPFEDETTGDEGEKSKNSISDAVQWAQQRVRGSTCVRIAVKEIAASKKAKEAALNLAREGDIEGDEDEEVIGEAEEDGNDEGTTGRTAEVERECLRETEIGERPLSLERHHVVNKAREKIGGETQKRKNRSEHEGLELDSGGSQKVARVALSVQKVPVEVPVPEGFVEEPDHVKLASFPGSVANPEEIVVEKFEGHDDFFLDSSPPPSLSESDFDSDEAAEVQLANGRFRRESNQKHSMSKTVNKKSKNRLGQRERQRLAEMKYGNSAKHIGKGSSRDSKPGPRAPPFVDKRNSLQGGRQVVGRRDEREKNMSYPKANARATGNISGKSREWREGSGPNQFRENREHSNKSREVLAQNHPSWAAKVAQAKMLAAAGTGKKTVFNDDD